MTALWESITTVVNAIFGFFAKYPLYVYATDIENWVVSDSGREYAAIDMLFVNFPGRLEYQADNSRYVLYGTYDTLMDMVANPLNYGNVLTITLFGIAITFVVIAAFRRILKSST